MRCRVRRGQYLRDIAFIDSADAEYRYVQYRGSLGQKL